MTLSKAELNAGLRKWQPLVAGMAKQFRGQFAVIHEFEDVVALGMIALWRALETFDAQNAAGANLQTYVRHCVLNAYLLEVKTLKRWRRRIAYHTRESLDAERPEGGKVFEFRSEHESPEEALLRSRREGAVRSAVRSLPKHYHITLERRYERGVGFQDIAAQYGGSRQLHQQREVRALNMLRPRFEREGLKP